MPILLEDGPESQDTFYVSTGPRTHGSMESALQTA